MMKDHKGHIALGLGTGIVAFGAALIFGKSVGTAFKAGSVATAASLGLLVAIFGKDAPEKMHDAEADEET